MPDVSRQNSDNLEFSSLRVLSPPLLLLSNQRPWTTTKLKAKTTVQTGKSTTSSTSWYCTANAKNEIPFSTCKFATGKQNSKYSSFARQTKKIQLIKNWEAFIPLDNFLLKEDVLDEPMGAHSPKLPRTELSSSSFANKEFLYQTKGCHSSPLQGSGSVMYLCK